MRRKTCDVFVIVERFFNVACDEISIEQCRTLWLFDRDNDIADVLLREKGCFEKPGDGERKGDDKSDTDRGKKDILRATIIEKCTEFCSLPFLESVRVFFLLFFEAI